MHYSTLRKQKTMLSRASRTRHIAQKHLCCLLSTEAKFRGNFYYHYSFRRCYNPYVFLGDVTFYNLERSFGFIKAENGSDFFVHQTGIAKEGFRSLKSEYRCFLSLIIIRVLIFFLSLIRG